MEGATSQKSGAYRITSENLPDRGVVEISAILIKSKDTSRQFALPMAGAQGNGNPARPNIVGPDTSGAGNGEA